jgi:predicted metallopeptidase
MRRVCEDMVYRVAELRHIDFSRVAVSFSQTRHAAGHGLYAALTPLRFEGGRTEGVRGGRKWGVQRVQDASGREMLYILSFYLPRFFDLAFQEKLVTVVHELWHIGPRSDGDLRRFRGRCYAHGGSRKEYDSRVAQIADKWLSLDPPLSMYEFLKYDFRNLVRRYGGVCGNKIPTPRLIPLE